MVNSQHELDSQATVRRELDGRPVVNSELPGDSKPHMIQTPPQVLPTELDTEPPRPPVIVPVANSAQFTSDPNPEVLHASTSGPVSTHLEGVDHRAPSRSDANASVRNQPGPVIGSATTIEELELQYLEAEEKRIRERKEALLRQRKDT
jgi:hypothetical protein